jgi:hypothetical protein
MKKLILILLVLYGCNTEEIKPDYRNEIKGTYSGIDQDSWNVPLVIGEKVIFNF